MTRCEQCLRQFDGTRCPGCGANAFSPSKRINQQLVRYFYFSAVGGLIIALLAQRAYALLDSTRFMLWVLFLAFSPVVPHIILSKKNLLAESQDRLKKLYLGCGAALVLLALGAVANGAFDQAPIQTVSTTVAKKKISSSRRSRAYIVVADSWRPGKDEESLTVNRGLYQTLKVGDSIVVDVHPGALGMPWYSRVAPE